MKPTIIMHVNYCEQGQTLEEMCRKAVGWGFDGIEFRRKRSGAEESAEEYLDILEKAARKSGLKHVLFGGPGANLMQADAAKRQEEIKENCEFYRLAAKRFRLTVCNVMSGNLLNPDKNVPYMDFVKHGSFIAEEKHWQWAAEGYREIGKTAGQLGLLLAFETHMCYLHDLPLAAKKLVDLIDSPAVGVNLDYGNTIYLPKIPTLKETITAVADKLYYVHLKNSARTFLGSDLVSTGLGDGDINHREYLRLLREAGYAGHICIEAPRSGDREWYAQQDIAYLNKLLAEINWV